MRSKRLYCRVYSKTQIKAEALFPAPLQLVCQTTYAVVIPCVKDPVTAIAIGDTQTGASGFTVGAIEVIKPLP